MFVLILALYNSVMTPFQFSFNYVMERAVISPFQEIEYLIDFLYLIDIIINFNTSYIDAYTGDEMFGKKKIAAYYLRNGFLIDFLSTFWFTETLLLFGVDETIGYINW